MLDQNLVEIPETEICEANVLMTLLSGEAVFSAAEDPVGEAGRATRWLM